MNCWPWSSWACDVDPCLDCMGKILFALLASCLALGAATTNVTFRWDQAPGDVVSAYRLYEIVGGNRVLLVTATAPAGAQQPANTATVPNWVLGTTRTVICTASNVFGEGPASLQCIVPPGPPSAPINLSPVPLSLVVPVPGTAEISTDLVDWRQRIRVAPAAAGEVTLTLVTHPTEPLMFMRSKTVAALVSPPVPR